jgi:hypothetical protein
MDLDKRLNRRFWLINHIEHLLRESELHKKHKDMFFLKKLLVWKLDEESGRVDIP